MKCILKLIIIASTVTFLYGCKKTADLPLESNNELEISKSQIQNLSNPFDSQGEVHNRFLDYFFQATKSSKVINREKLLKVTQEFYFVNKLDFMDSQVKAYGQLFDTYHQIEIGRPGPVLPPNLCRWFPSICDILTPSPTFPGLPTNFLSDENGGSSTDRTLEFIQKVKELEDYVLKNEKLTQEQQNARLTQYAIARYSAAYWHNVKYIQKDKSPSYGSFQDLAAYPNSSCHTCDVVRADSGGGVVSAIIEGVSPGPGAALASAAAVLQDSWNWSWH